MKVKPTYNRILIQKPEANKTTESGIIIQGKPTEKTVLAKVLAVGPGETDKTGKIVPMFVKVDDIVVVLAEAGEELKFAGDGVFMVSYLDIIAVIDESDES